VDVFGYGLISLAVYLWAFPRPPFSYRERDVLRSRKLIVAFTIFAVVLCTGSNISLAPPLRLISVLASFAILVGAFIDIVRTSLRPRR
jgi:hypothetical protein